ncbi:hypothetical protein QW060_25180 [Myroides ceti]|uniref:Major facilitator superfamily (MFS) profile domain-containing protein n=1 Tax=Paenimyroides ceti TaxID=395087 RepID=A0ABT8D1C7_9FLAO|nr:hypothetical protein [Paenimyroides ceti]MDN3710171.1 hypothetical protein [Paenimyroides ceti]
MSTKRIYGFTFLGVYMTASLGFSLKSAGIVLSCFGVGSILGSFVGGWLTDKFGSFKIQTMSLFFSIFLSDSAFFQII